MQVVEDEPVDEDGDDDRPDSPERAAVGSLALSARFRAPYTAPTIQAAVTIPQQTQIAISAMALSWRRASLERRRSA
jgi:hypothetical protein